MVDKRGKDILESSKNGVVDMIKDPFKEYIKESEPEKRERGYAWHTAIGLQTVDGLTPSKYLIETAIQNIEGEITLDKAAQLLERYYEQNPKDKDKEDDRTEEADKVSVRITRLLSEKAFSFSPTQYLAIHKKLFEGIYDHAGRMRDYNITKKEWVLDGGTVLYGSASELQATLEYDFSQEKDYSYQGLSMQEIIHHLAIFVSRLWQIHVFAEGNTRTTAVFFIKYLRTLGFDVTNDIFAEHAWYFRNALVRANYNDLKNGIHETTEFLELFLENLLLDEHNDLHNRSMHISGMFSDDLIRDSYSSKEDIQLLKDNIPLPEQDIVEKKQDIDIPKQDITSLNAFREQICKYSFSKKTLKNMEKLYKKYGFNIVFGRTDVMKTIGITASPASELIKKLLESDIIYHVTGMGKGKYKFRNQDEE